MTVSIPSNLIVRSKSFRPMRFQGSFTPYVGSTIYNSVNAGKSDRWHGVFSFIPVNGSDMLTFEAWLLGLGKSGTFYAYDPTRVQPLGGVVSSMVVDGGGQTGYSIQLRNGPVSSTPLLAGEDIQIGDQYFRLTSDFTTNSSGVGTANIWPAIRSSFADGETVVTDGPVLIARVTSKPDFRKEEAKPSEASISWEEAI